MSDLIGAYNTVAQPIEPYQAPLPDSLNVEDRARRGAMWLDSINKDWYKKVPVDHIYINTVDSCICGWVFADMHHENGYGWAANQYGMEWDKAIPEDMREDTSGCYYHGFSGGPNIEHHWRMEIAHRYAINA